jgi:phosphate starvation-inducible PhoH-like protein
MPGDVVTPELRAETVSDHLFEPALDVLNELIGPEKVAEHLERRLIQMMPLGALPGRTFNDAFIVIDDAQNMNPAKLRMALTRLGRDSCMVVLGDPARPAVIGDEACGLSQVLQMIEGLGVAHVHSFGAGEVVRNATVAKLESLYAGQA